MLKLFKLSLTNLYSKKISSFFLIFFISFIFTILSLFHIGFRTFNLFLEDYYSHGFKNSLVVSKREDSVSSFLGIISNSNSKITNNDIDIIKKIDAVEEIYKSSFFKAPSIMNISVLGNNLETDVFFVGLERGFENYKNNDDFIPMLVSKEAVSSIGDILFKDSSVLKSKGEKYLFDLEFNIEFSKSLFFENSGKSVKKIGKIVGFSDDVGVIFIGIPLNVLEDINKSLGLELNIDRLFVNYDSLSQVEKIKSEISSLGFSVSKGDEKLESIKKVVNIFYFIIGFLISVFLFIVFYSVISTILISIKDNKKYNAIVFSLGISRGKIMILYFLEGFYIYFAGFLISIFLTKIFTSYIGLILEQSNNFSFFIKFPNINFNFSDLLFISIIFLFFLSILFLFSFLSIIKVDFNKDI